MLRKKGHIKCCVVITTCVRGPWRHQNTLSGRSEEEQRWEWGQIVLNQIHFRSLWVRLCSALPVDCPVTHNAF